MTVIVDESVNTTLPDMHLKDIGKREGGAVPAEAFREIFAQLYKDITSPVVTDALKKELKALGLKDVPMRDDTKKRMEQVTGKVKGLFGK